MQIISYVLLLVCVAFAGLCFNVAYRLLSADKIEADKSAARVRTIWDAIMGRTLVRTDWSPDSRIQHGLVFNRKMNRIEINGRMSRGVFDRIFR